MENMITGKTDDGFPASSAHLFYGVIGLRGGQGSPHEDTDRYLFDIMLAGAESSLLQIQIIKDLQSASIIVTHISGVPFRIPQLHQIKKIHFQGRWSVCN